MDLDEFGADLDNCDLYIEDLKSEDPNVKVHAVSKLYSIAQIIGKERIRNDLLPQILEIAQIKENEDEFILQLTEQLGELRNALDKADMYILIPSLKVLACIDEPGIREKAVAKLKLIAEDQNEVFFVDHFLPLIKELAVSENYAGRITASSLFAVCYSNLPKNKKAEIRHFFTQLSNDSVALVRRAIAANLKNTIDAFDKEYIKANIIPLFSQLIKDDSDSVKINAIENSIHLIPYYQPEEIPVNLISLLKNTDPELRSWRVRYALPEALVGFSSEIDLEIVRCEILPLFENLLNDTEPEVRSRALTKLPEIFDKLTSNQLENEVINKLKALVTDTSLHVRLASASVLSQLCPILERGPLLSRLLPLVQILLRDEIIDVKIAAIKVLKSFNEKIGTHDVETDILPLMQAITKEKQWRCRLSLTEAFPEICKGMKLDNFRENFADFMFGFVTDHYCAVREQTLGNIDQFIQIYGFPQLSEKITSTLQELIVNQNYLFRITALKMLGKLSYSFDVTTFEDTLEIMVESLYKDKVPNVRLILVQTLEELSPKISKQFANSYIIPTLEKLSSDKDSDVSYFANKALFKCKNIR